MQIVALKPLCAIVVLTGAVAVAWAYRTPARPAPAAPLLYAPPPEAQSASRRAAVKSLLARRVLVERIPLPEAAELFRRANGEDGLAALLRAGTGRSAREKLCRQVIAYATAAEAEMRAEGVASHVWGTAAELEADLRRRLAAGEFPPEPGAEKRVE